ncbi:MAG TPA: BON domain-containing protein [Planctomycetaceae bacterium]|nr:BON domain-containing protein [Planctomycetaceae bacterium]
MADREPVDRGGGAIKTDRQGRRPNLDIGELESNRQLTEAVGRALGATGYTALRGVVVEVSSDAVVLQGRVSTYYEKQVAHATARILPMREELAFYVSALIVGPLLG